MFNVLPYLYTSGAFIHRVKRLNYFVLYLRFSGVVISYQVLFVVMSFVLQYYVYIGKI